MKTEQLLRARPGSGLIEPRQIFTLLVVFRWISLIPPLVYLILTVLDQDPVVLLWLALLLAAGLNLLITLFYERLNQALLVRPWLLLVDIIIASLLVALSGGWQTPYYLYILSPLLAGAFFFQLRGALVAAALFTPLYLAAVFLGENTSPNWLAVAMAIVGFFLISGTFGTTSGLVATLRGARDELATAHRDLQVVHDLTNSLQRATDVNEVEERVLEAVTDQLGFARAVVALVDRDTQIVSAWMGRNRHGHVDTRLPHSAQIPMSPEGGAVSEALLQGRPHTLAQAPLTADETINAHLGMREAHIFPLMLRENSVGVLLVDSGDDQEEAASFQSLEAIASQAAVTLGTTMMCIDRAQRMAVQEERIRIAQDIHDTVSQSLFGIVYTLDGSLKLLPGDPQAAMPELERALTAAEETRAEIRKSIQDIWPSELTARRFEADLRRYAANVCQIKGLRIDFSINGDFSHLPPRARRSLYRISQEAVANIAHHAGASNAQICLDITEESALLSVRDDGRGFDPHKVQHHDYGGEHFGLWGMQERASSLGGSCEINSSPGAGTSIMVEIPL